MTTDDKQPLWRVLLRCPKPKRERTAFVTGDATGSVFRDVTTDADDFVVGDRKDSVFENIRHERRRKPQAATRSQPCITFARLCTIWPRIASSCR